MSIQCTNLGLEWPNGNIQFHNITYSFDQNIYALVGVNGIGKSTFAKILNGELHPTSGHVQYTKDVYLFNQVETPPEQDVLSYLSDRDIYDDYQILNFLNAIDFSLSCCQLSGGQWARVRLIHALLSNKELIIFDEPTNHLDLKGKNDFVNLLQRNQKAILLISHDRELLMSVNIILELNTKGLSVFTGDYLDYEKEKSIQKEVVLKKLDDAKKERDKKQKEILLINEKGEKRKREGKKAALKGGMPKILLGLRKSNAENTFSKNMEKGMARIEEASEAVKGAFKQVELESILYAKCPDVIIPQSKVMLEAFDFNYSYENDEKWIWSENLNFVFYGAERIALKGGNGTGKTTLLNFLTKKLSRGIHRGWAKIADVPFGYLDQNFESLTLESTVFEEMRNITDKSESEIRSFLASYLLFESHIHKKIAYLSGGEKMRLSLAKIFIQEKVEMLFLDEPTNNLDFSAILFLENFLAQYKGVLVVISHDSFFLEKIKITKEVKID